jgi:hypothetical protein
MEIRERKIKVLRDVFWNHTLYVKNALTHAIF